MAFQIFLQMKQLISVKIVVFLKISIFLLKGGSPLPDDKLQECFKKTVRRGKEVRDLTYTACNNIDR